MVQPTIIAQETSKSRMSKYIDLPRLNKGAAKFNSLVKRIHFLISDIVSFQREPLSILMEEGFLLPDLDSNQDKQSQSLSYYRYTIRQY